MVLLVSLSLNACLYFTACSCYCLCLSTGVPIYQAYKLGQHYFSDILGYVGFYMVVVAHAATIPTIMLDQCYASALHALHLNMQHTITWPCLLLFSTPYPQRCTTSRWSRRYPSDH